MLGLGNGTVVIQGKTYNLHPYSPYYLSELNTKGAQLVKDQLDGKITEFEYFDKLLRIVIADEPKWDVTAKDFDGREAENAVLAFVPPSKQMYLLLSGFQSV